MNILIFSHEFPPYLGGAGTVANTLYYSLLNKGYKVTVVTSSHSCNLGDSNIINQVGIRKLWPWNYKKTIKKCVEDTNYDFIICNDAAAIYTAGKYFSAELLNKTICYIHGDETNLLRLSSLNFKTLFITLISFRKYYYNAMRKCNKIIFVSDFIKCYFLDNYNFNDYTDKSVVIHSGINKNTFYYDPSIRNLNELCPTSFLSKKVVFTASRIIEMKGFDNMLYILEEIYKRYPNFEWHIAGEGSYKDEFELKVKGSTLSKNIFFLGKLNPDQLRKKYSDSHVYFSLSELKESYGLSLLEAASCGCFPISYDCYGAVEVFKYIDSGLKIKNNNTYYIEKIYNVIVSDKVQSNAHRNCDDFILDFTSMILNDEHKDEK